MGLLCARLSCGQPASASLQFDADGSIVIIIDLADTTAGIPICRAHARTRSAPMGWTLDDRRTVAQPSQWADRAEQEPRQVPMIDRSVTITPTEIGPADRPARRRDEDLYSPGFEFGQSEATAMPPTSVTTASSPLLARAFRSTD